MKRKDMIYLILAVVILAVTGYIGYGLLVPKSAQTNQVQVEVITPIQAEFDQSALRALSDDKSARDFTPLVDLSNGLGNPKPFNPL